MTTSPDDLPEQYIQLALFTERRVVSWNASLPEALPNGLLSKSTHALFAARSVSTALFESVDVPREQETEPHIFLNRRRIHLPDASKAIFLNCSDDKSIAGYPITPGLWLGLFTRGFSSLRCFDNTGALLARIALAAEVLPPLNLEGNEARLTYFWDVLREFYLSQCTDDDGFSIMRVMKHLDTLSGVSPQTVGFPRQFSDFSLFDTPVRYEASILDALRTAQLPTRKQWWVVAACVLSNDGRVLKAEGISHEHASVFAWRYQSIACAKDGYLDYNNEVLLRSLYTLGALSLCVLTSQSEITQTPRVSPKELDELAKRAVDILKDVKHRLRA